jgi:hypothetical protein
VRRVAAGRPTRSSLAVVETVPDDVVAYLREFVSNPPPLHGRLAGTRLEPSTETISFEDGLTADEFDGIERRFGFTFPADLRLFLSLGLPVSKGFPDWRSGAEDDLRGRLSWPADSICWDVEHNDFWLDEWGPRPVELADAQTIAREHIDAAPTLIPIYIHRYVPEEPSDAGNPIFSVYQTDIIVYGHGLRAYLDHEFGRARGTGAPARRIPFWTHLVDLNIA